MPSRKSVVNNVFGQPQTVVVLGGSSDIARAITKRLCAARAHTVILAGRSQELLDVAASEARQMRVEGNVVLSVTFLANGQVVVHGVIQGLGHGLDEEAKRVAQQIRFRPATNNGQPVDVTTKITITFQLA